MGKKIPVRVGVIVAPLLAVRFLNEAKSEKNEVVQNSGFYSRLLAMGGTVCFFYKLWLHAPQTKWSTISNAMGVFFPLLKVVAILTS